MVEITVYFINYEDDDIAKYTISYLEQSLARILLKEFKVVLFSQQKFQSTIFSQFKINRFSRVKFQACK